MNDIIALGDQGGAGNMIICEVVKIHISEDVLDGKGGIDQHKIDLIARMGGNWYTRATPGLFEVEKPLTTLGIGVDAIPDDAKKSGIFAGNDLGILGNVEVLPTTDDVKAFLNENPEITNWVNNNNSELIYKKAKAFLSLNQVSKAWKTILAIKK